MQIINNQKYINNEQIEKIISLMDVDNYPKRIVIFTNRIEKLYFIIKNIFKIREVLLIQNDNFYNILTDTIYLLVDKNQKNVTNKQFRLLKDLFYAIRERHYYNDDLKQDEIKLMDVFQMSDIAYTTQQLANDNYYTLIDNFVVNFVNDYAKSIKDIMSWENEQLIGE